MLEVVRGKERDVAVVQSLLASGGPGGAAANVEVYVLPNCRVHPVATGSELPCLCSRSLARDSREEGAEEDIPEKLSRSSRLLNSALRGPAWLPREERKREDVSGVCRLSRGAEGEEWSGREGAELGGRPPLDMHSPL